MIATRSKKSNFRHIYLLYVIALFFPGYPFWAQCKGVSIASVSLSIVERPCGPTATGSLALEVKGGLAPFTLTWTIDNDQNTNLPQSANTNQFTIEDLRGAMKPGYVVRVKDACGNEASSTPIQLINSVAVQIASAPQVISQVSKKEEPNGSIRVEVYGGTPPRTVTATDSKGQTFTQQFPVGPPEKGKFIYDIYKLPAEIYQIEVKSGSKKCTQVWKESIELKALEK